MHVHKTLGLYMLEECVPFCRSVGRRQSVETQWINAPPKTLILDPGACMSLSHAVHCHQNLNFLVVLRGFGVVFMQHLYAKVFLTSYYF